jgi:hypothetical protein
MAGFANDTEVRERDGRLAATLSRDWEILGLKRWLRGVHCQRAVGKIVAAEGTR